ncbi:GntR family transcriptional regulator [Sedimentibacter hydroxybenzoicus DSM 7310]|uniref:GntR family transcriptional regulator n=1 Tax=Sedimentibacter hydroxybenzoicus DSM 7310 TaxID=1123245 RepID=A0A974BID2_SEDHY|nr:GntR family transcriptional regulator [Sedimentibacter hydroxybenzoicus]NYB73352.1 GntR family transcriptional regulator [Sedimentibacter hydroxybenzoicus DSM 7310]
MKECDTIKNKSYIPPAYIQIRDILVEKINTGELKSDNQLPSERELSETYKISRMTARNALTQLVDSGYAYRLKGKGTFVRFPKIERDFVRLSGFSQMLKSKGIKPSNKIVKSGIVVADKKIASLLETTMGTKVYEIVRIRYGNDIALALEYSYLPVNLFDNLLQYDFENDSLYKVIEENYNYKLKYSKQWIKIITLNKEESKLLNVKENTPAFLLESISYDMDEKVVESTLSLNIGDKTAFYTELWPSNI